MRFAAFGELDRAGQPPAGQTVLDALGRRADLRILDARARFWETYRASTPTDDGATERALIYQLLWCLEYDDSSSRHAADTARLRRRLAVT